MTNSAQSVFPEVLNDNSGLPRECVVVFGDPIPSGTFGHWHLWLTQNWINNWINQAGIGNGGSDATLVDGGGRIIYNIAGRYAGSPYHQYTGSPVTTLGGMNWSVPDDDLMFGTHSLNKQHVPGNGPLDDNTIQREQTCLLDGAPARREVGLPAVLRPIRQRQPARAAHRGFTDARWRHAQRVLSQRQQRVPVQEPRVV